MNVVLVEPEIPQNTGNIVRTCAVTGTALHLVHPLGFSTADRYLKRAGLDYWQHLKVTEHKNLDSLLTFIGPRPFYLFTTRGSRSYHKASFAADCFLIFGRETAGLPGDLVAAYKGRSLRIPMRESQRSLNLSNAVAIVVYEALRQQGFAGLG